MKRTKRAGGILRVLLFVSLIASSVIFAACGSENDEIDLGALPVLKVGDTWTQKGTVNGTEYTIVTTVKGEDVINGLGVYIIDGSVEPLISDIVDKMTQKMDKYTLFPFEERMYNEDDPSSFDMTTSYSYQISGDPYFPMKVGNVSTFVSTEKTVTATNGITETSTVNVTEIYKVEGIEDITVPAGTFKCFKVVRYDENNTALDITWESAKVKHFSVKKLDSETNETSELISYSISD